MYFKIVNTLLAFCIVFGFPLPGIHNSTVLAAILIVVLRPKTIFLIGPILRNEYVRKIFFYLFFIMFYSFFVALYNQTGELDIIRSLINQLFIFFTVLLFYASLHKTVTIDETHWYLLNAYVVQSIIILLAYNIPAFEDLVRTFQSEGIRKVTEEGYDGFRGLALAAGQFYWISGAYAMIFVLFAYKIVEQKRSLWEISLFVLVFTASLFTGRTIFIGVFFGLLLFLVNSDFKQTFKFYVFGGVIMIILFYLLPPSFFEGDFYNWAFEMFINYESDGELSTRSSDALLQGMIYIPPLKTFFLGDGLWATGGADGGYYGATDSGIMRVLLFYGVMGLVVYFMFAVFVTFGLFKTTKLNTTLGFRFLLILFVFQLVLNIKGQSLGYMTSTQAILFMFFIPYALFNEATKTNT